MAFEKVSTQLDFQQKEKEVLAFWKAHRVFERSMEQREGKEVFSFYDGPPTANGKPHIGHILTRVIKDIIPRYKTMKGYHVRRKAGWDTHGLPVELEVEKALGLSGKPQIEAYGVEPFIRRCKESVWKYKAEWENMSERIGFWADMEHPYITYDNDYIESVWWAIKEIDRKGLLYKGHKVVPYCPRCGTALSSHEVAQGYKDVKELSAIARFKVKGEESTFLLAWTTTPWTLPSNVCLTVNPHKAYVRAKKGGETYILAKALCDAVLGEDTYEVVDECEGKALFGLEYEPLYSFGALDKKAHYVVHDDYVTLTDGTGIVHCAPAFGEDDARVGRVFDLPFVQLVDAQGLFVEGTGELEGKFVKDADPIVLKDLKDRGLLFEAKPYEHSYPFCWRCDTPLLYYARSTWFVRMTAVKENLLKNNASVNWLPEHIRDGRMGNFLENVIDWGLSRERYWGTPLPVWMCECGERHVIGSIEELCRMGRDVPADIELHKPMIDGVTIPCAKCGGDMQRVPEVIDCWFDSGSMPFAQFHYPFENKDLFEKQFPADFISEAIDQTRGWFYTLLAISTVLFDKAPFENCIVMGHVLDKDGVKMSKHKYNVVDPWEVLDKQGADALRWYFYVAGAPWQPSRFSGDMVSEVQRKFIGTLVNTYAFFALYAGIDSFEPKGLSGCALTEMDRWVLSRLQTTVGEVEKNLDSYHITEAARALLAFVDELSNWYVRRCRERFWGKGMQGDKVAAFETLYHVLVTLSKALAPFLPFLSEDMYQNLVRSANASAPVSVHLTDFPGVDAAYIDKALEADMQATMQVVFLGRACRNASSMKVRQPLARALVQGMTLPENMCRLVEEELNVKACELVASSGAYTDYRLKPQLRTLGRRYGKLVPGIAAKLLELDGVASVETLQAGGTLAFEVDGTAIELAAEDVLIEALQKEGYVSQSEGGVTVVLDTQLTEALIAEGYAREIVSKIQTMRKENGFEVTDRVHVGVKAEGALAAAIALHKEAILSDVLGLSLELTEAENGREWDINGQPAKLEVTRA